jgi:hypothetical protein
MIYTNYFIICIIVIINKQTIHFILMKSVTWIFFKQFMNVVYITKKCYKLERIDNMKTCAIVPFQYPIKS